MTDKEKILKGFEELNAIIEPYKNKRNYNKLCLRLRFWAKNFQIRLLWKKAPVSEDLEEAAFDYAEACKYEGGEKLLCIEHFKAGAKRQKEQLMEDAIDATVESDPDSHGADYGLQKLHIDYGQLEAKGIKPGTKVKVIIIKED